MIVRAHLVPFRHPRDRAARLPCIVVAGLALLLVALWNPVSYPGPVMCVARLAFGIPCPLCGGTRGAALCLRGQPLEATAYNPLSIPALVLVVALLVRWSGEYLSGKRLVFEGPAWVGRAIHFLVIAIVVGTWIYLLCYRIEDDFASCY